MTEAKVRAGITADASARAAGLDVEMIGPVRNVSATRGSEAERALALAKLRERRPDASSCGGDVPRDARRHGLDP